MVGTADMPGTGPCLPPPGSRTHHAGSAAGESAAAGTLVKQATLLSFLDCFRMLAVMAMACLPPVLLFRCVRSSPGPAVVD